MGRNYEISAEQIMIDTEIPFLSLIEMEITQELKPGGHPPYGLVGHTHNHMEEGRKRKGAYVLWRHKPDGM